MSNDPRRRYASGLLQDRSRKQTDILENIEMLLAQQVGSDQIRIENKSDSHSDGGPSGVRLMDANRYVALETTNLDEANTNGTVTLQPGDSQALIRWDRELEVAIMAIGAVDKDDVQYEIRANHDQTVGGVTQSPLGTINDPFSFVQELGAAVPVQTFEYVATLSQNASSPVDLAARAHMEVVGT